MHGDTILPKEENCWNAKTCIATLQLVILGSLDEVKETYVQVDDTLYV